MSTTSKNNTKRELQYQFIDGAELIDRYEPGGYHPIQIGDALGPGSRYLIIHKLGFGGYSTSWLAQDRENDQRLVAIKIAAAAPQATNSINDEERILRRLQSAQVDLPGKLYATRKLIDGFSLDGPNGTHRCLVMEPGRASVHDSREASYWLLFQPEVARSVAAQLIHAVQFLHSQNVVHGGTYAAFLSHQDPPHFIDGRELTQFVRLAFGECTFPPTFMHLVY